MLRSAGRLFRRVLMLFGAVVLFVTLFPPRWYVRLLAGPWTDPKGKVLIVLAADGVNEGMLGETSYWRSVYAVWAWREGGFQNMIISGDRHITVPMRDFLICQGVPAAAVTVENRSTDTHENADFTTPIARNFPGPYVLLTSDYHMWRAHRAFSRAGLTVLPRPLPDALKRLDRWSARWPIFLELVTETAKIAYYWVRRWI